MPLATLHYRSALLEKAVGMTVLLPSRGVPPFATLYLLHGLSDDHTIWTRQTRLESHFGDSGLMVVMPDGFRNWYTDNAEGRPYGRHLADEVIETAERYFPADARPAKRGIGGLSMGGYGAMRAALAHPDRFASAHSHSGAVSIDRFVPGSATPRPPSDEIRRVFGPDPVGSDHDLTALARRAKADGGPMPKLRIDCGVNDFLIGDNRRFHADLEEIGVEHEYLENPGEHDWDYWDRHVVGALAFHADAMGVPPQAAP